MFNLKSISIALVCMGAISCSESVQDENIGPEEGTTRTASVAFAAEGAGDLSVYVFSKSNDAFLYHSVLNDGWITQENGTRKLYREMKEGEYKFVFLGNRCNNLALPEMPTRAGEFYFEDMIISHSVTSKEGYFRGADEIYMQDDAALAALAHTVSGNKEISAHLTRAVGKIEVQLVRGYATDVDGETTFVPVPYTGDENITDLFEGYEIEVIDCGDHLSIGGCNGKAKIYEQYAVEDTNVRTILADDEDNDGTMTGFAVLDGPFVLPPAEDSDMQVRVKLTPKAGSGLTEFEKTLVNGIDGVVNVPRNHKLTITFWLDAQSSPVISVTANLADMDKENPGDSGMWY